MGSGAQAVSDVMTREVVTIDMNETLLTADRLMDARGVRHLVVLDLDRAVTGILSRRDVYRPALRDLVGYGSAAQDKLLDSLRVKDAMRSPVITTKPETPLRDAARVLIDERVGCLPVLADGALVGIVTEGDFVRLAAR